MEMPEELRPGNSFQGYAELQVHVIWHSIPAWLAGDWVSSQYRVLKSWDHTTGAYYTLPSGSDAYNYYHLGDLADAKGTVWTALISPEIKDLDLGDRIDSQNVVATKIAHVTTTSFAIRERIFHVVINKQDRRILEAYTQEKVTEFGRVEGGMVVAAEYNTLYNADGTRTMTTNAVLVLKRRAQFAQVSFRNGVDLLISLSDHLQNVGLGHLVAW